MLKSLAHPDWPYAGSPHEWRGFVKGGRDAEIEALKHDIDRHLTIISDIYTETAVYQKQNFGPELK